MSGGPGERPLVVCMAGEGEGLARTLERHPDADIALVGANVRLPYAWDARLRKAAYAAPHIAAAIPMSDVSPMFALAGTNGSGDAPPDADLVDRLAYIIGTRSYYEVPRIHDACAYIRRDALDRALEGLPNEVLSSPDFLDALARRWRATGWTCVMCDYIYVGSAPDSRRLKNPDDVETRAFVQHHPLAGLRLAVDDAVRRGLAPMSLPGLDAKPVQLHIMHFWGGGLDRWVRDFGRSDASRVNMILASYRIGDEGGQRLVLYSDPMAMIPVRTWDIARPIRSSAVGSIEYRRILEQIVAEFEVEAIIVSSLIGHAFDALTQPVKTIVVCHDFYPICQAISPSFGKTCERCTVEDLGRCYKSNPLNRFFTDQTVDEWHAMRSAYVEQLLSRRIEMVVPSQSVADTLRQLDPRLENVPIHVVPHGIDIDAPKVGCAPPAEKLRVVVLGRLSSLQKGAQLLREASEGLKPFAEVTLVGCGANGMKLAEECGWPAIENYELDELPDLLRSLEPHLGLLASIVPETFSYTLSELTALGIPPVVTAVGSFKERVRDGETGFLFEPRPEALVTLLRKLHDAPAALDAVARNLAALARGRTTAEMVADYDALLPMEACPVARFRVGIGQQTALTEPYRQLTEAYSQLSQSYERMSGAYSEADAAYAQANEAYEQAKAAYAQAKSAYEVVHGALENRAKVIEEWHLQFESLRIGRHWWRAPKAARLVNELRQRIALAEPHSAQFGDSSTATPAPETSSAFPWAEKLSPRLLKSPWWIGHIPFAFELIARLRPAKIVELGTYSGSSFAAFCQAVEACGIDGKCYGIDLWEGDIHMGHFDDSLFQEISEYLATNHPGIAVLVRKDFNAAVHDFDDGSIDLLHIDGTHTYEAVSNDFNTWLPKMSRRGVVLFHDINVNMENTGPASLKFGVGTFFDGVKSRYPHFEFGHCWGLGVLVVGADAPPAVMELVALSRKPEFEQYFAAKGAAVTKRFEDMGVKLPVHEPYGPVPYWRRAARKLRRVLRGMAPA